MQKRSQIAPGISTGASSRRHHPPASSGKVFAQRPARIRCPETSVALQFRHEKIDDVVEHLDLLVLGMAQHEAAAASRALEAFFEIIGDLGCSAGYCGGVTGRGPQAMLHKLIERSRAFTPQGWSQ